jgi:hypothetical protein
MTPRRIPRSQSTAMIRIMRRRVLGDIEKKEDEIEEK